MKPPSDSPIDGGRPPALPSATLLACPFCDELPEYKPWTQGHAPGYSWPHQIVHNCKVIGVQICVRAHKLGLPDTKESVFQIWNTRTTDMKTSPAALPVVACSDLLAACPHCHKTTEDKDPHTEQRAVAATTYTEGNACVVQCNSCGLSGPIFGTIDEAIEAWNKLPRNAANS